MKSKQCGQRTRLSGRRRLALLILLVRFSSRAAPAPRPASDVPEAVLRARLAKVAVHGTRPSDPLYSAKGFLVAPGRVVTYAHGRKPGGRPGDEYVAYGVEVKGIRSELGHIWLDRLPGARPLPLHG